MERGRAIWELVGLTVVCYGDEVRWVGTKVMQGKLEGTQVQVGRKLLGPFVRLFVCIMTCCSAHALGIMDHENFTMTAAAWDSINGFVSDVGWSFVFGLNVLLRSPWPVGSWYPDNAVSLMEYTHTRGYQVDWELGNGEPVFACILLACFLAFFVLLVCLLSFFLPLRMIKQLRIRSCFHVLYFINTQNRICSMKLSQRYQSPHLSWLVTSSNSRL